MTDNLFFVEHYITDKEAWAGFMGKWMDILGVEDMTVDKGMQSPEWEGNECLLTCPDSTGLTCVCLWKLPSHMTMDDFQEFINRFTCGTCTNKVYSVKEALGHKNLDSRGYMRDMINAAQGRESPGYLDSPMFWMTHHQITDKKGWESAMEEMAVTIRKDCITPSDIMKLFPKGHGSGLLLFLSDDTCMGFDGGPAGMTKAEYQKFVDDFVKGTAINVVYLLDTKDSTNVFNLTEDVFNQDMLKWGNAYVNPYTKTASHEHTPVAAQGIHFTSQ